MQSFLNSVSAVAVVMLLMLAGYLMGRAGWMRPEHKPFLTRLIISVGMPCMCLNNIQRNFTHDMLLDAAALLLIPLISMLSLIAAALWLGKRLRLPRERLGPFVAMGGLSNSIFIGYPMCLELFGEACVPYVMGYYLVNTVVFQTLGVGFISRSGAGGGRLLSPAGLKKVLTNPPFAAIAACIALLLLDIRLPRVIMSFTGYLGNIVSPLGLIFSGFVVYEIGLRGLRPDRGHAAMLGMRFILSPLLCMMLCALFGVGGLARSVNVVEMSMPVMTQVVVMSAKFSADERYAAKGAALSTLCSFLAIPLLMAIV